MRALITLFFTSVVCIGTYSQVVFKCLECQTVMSSSGVTYSNFTGLEVTNNGKKSYLFQPIKAEYKGSRVILTDAFGSSLSLKGSQISSHPTPTLLNELLSGCYCGSGTQNIISLYITATTITNLLDDYLALK